MALPPQPAPTIRRAVIADAPTVAQITDQAYAHYLPLLGRKPQPMTADHAAMIRDHAVWLLVEEDRVLAILELIDEPDGMLIYSIAVRPDLQKRGLGRQMLAWAEAEAVRAGHRRIRLYTNARTEDNLRLYSRLGYEETAREPYLGSTLVHMAKAPQDGAPRSSIRFGGRDPARDYAPQGRPSPIPAAESPPPRQQTRLLRGGLLHLMIPRACD